MDIPNPRYRYLNAIHWALSSSKTVKFFKKEWDSWIEFEISDECYEESVFTSEASEVEGDEGVM